MLSEHHTGALTRTPHTCAHRVGGWPAGAEAAGHATYSSLGTSSGCPWRGSAHIRAGGLCICIMLIQTILYKHAQNLVSTVTLDPVNLT